MIKCIKCKTDFDQGDSNLRLCNGCRYNNDKKQRKRANDKRQLIRKKKLKPEYYHKTCPVCEREFKTLFENKKYCTKKCKEQTSKLPIQLENAERMLEKLENRIIKVNELYEEKMNKLESQLDYYNYNAEKQRQTYENNILRIENILTLTNK
jgi:hypothetical protein